MVDYTEYMYNEEHSHSVLYGLACLSFQYRNDNQQEFHDRYCQQLCSDTHREILDVLLGMQMRSDISAGSEEFLSNLESTIAEERSRKTLVNT